MKKKTTAEIIWEKIGSGHTHHHHLWFPIQSLVMDQEEGAIHDHYTIYVVDVVGQITEQYHVCHSSPI
jgi:hypothetical protein